MTSSPTPPHHDRSVLPESFLWGCATSPTQVEGETVNDWRNVVARDGTRADDGPRHWHRMEFDLACLSEVGANAYRFGFDWGRLQPEPYGELDRKVGLQYLELLAELRLRGITPMLTLFHFACPVWLSLRGGWLSPEAPALFADFAGKVATLIDGEIQHYVTINEPGVYALMSRVLGEFPPCDRQRWDRGFRVLMHLARGHRLALRAIKAVQPEAKVGWAKHCKHFVPARRWHPMDRLTCWGAHQLFDRLILRLFDGKGDDAGDWLGVNDYGLLRFRNLTALAPVAGMPLEDPAPYGTTCDDMWEQDPAGLVDCLQEMARRTGLPLYITAYGVATEDESLRSRMLQEHVAACLQAVKEGTDLRGFFYHSLLDGFEWNDGLSKRFGLIAVDYAHPKRYRRIRPAGRLYAQLSGNRPT